MESGCVQSRRGREGRQGVPAVPGGGSHPHGQWNGTSRIGLAVSEDGIRFERHPEPVLIPTEPYEADGGCEDPRVTQIGPDTYYMTYTAYDGKNARMCLATSKDLFNWRSTASSSRDGKGTRPGNGPRPGAFSRRRSTANTSCISETAASGSPIPTTRSTGNP